MSPYGSEVDMANYGCLASYKTIDDKQVKSLNASDEVERQN